jgi:ubiquinone/menaquinone biosynthesis C-methylase UbiE
LQILDLGCGIGRNSIPMARMVKDSGGRVLCVDLLQKALDQLEIYSKQYKVESVITTHPADISNFSFLKESYNYIVAASSLEHVKSESILRKVLNSMVNGTKVSGINLIYMNTNIREITVASGAEREPLFEILISKDEMLANLHEAYQDWEILYVNDQPMELEITRDETPVMLKADHLVFAARRLRCYSTSNPVAWSILSELPFSRVRDFFLDHCPRYRLGFPVDGIHGLVVGFGFHYWVGVSTGFSFELASASSVSSVPSVLASAPSFVPSFSAFLWRVPA